MGTTSFITRRLLRGLWASTDEGLPRLVSFSTKGAQIITQSRATRCMERSLLTRTKTILQQSSTHFHRFAAGGRGSQRATNVEEHASSVERSSAKTNVPGVTAREEHARTAQINTHLDNQIRVARMDHLDQLDQPKSSGRSRFRMETATQP